MWIGGIFIFIWGFSLGWILKDNISLFTKNYDFESHVGSYPKMPEVKPPRPWPQPGQIKKNNDTWPPNEIIREDKAEPNKL
jgi:hypothetical protein